VAKLTAYAPQTLAAHCHATVSAGAIGARCKTRIHKERPKSIDANETGNATNAQTMPNPAARAYLNQDSTNFEYGKLRNSPFNEGHPRSGPVAGASTAG